MMEACAGWTPPLADESSYPARAGAGDHGRGGPEARIAAAHRRIDAAAVIPTSGGGENLCWEFKGPLAGYVFVYIDSVTGKEAQIFRSSIRTPGCWWCDARSGPGREATSRFEWRFMKKIPRRF
jgi:hypothetical protein